MTLAEILAKVTGLETQINADKQAAATALAAETQARAALEAKLTEANAEIARVTALAPPPAKKEGEGEVDPPDIKDAIDTLEKAIANWKKIAGAEGSDDDESKAEDSSDMANDEEAKAAMASKKYSKVLAIRSAQAIRRQAFAQKRQTAKAIQAGITKGIAALGIPTPLALNKDGANPLRAQKPTDLRSALKHSHAMISGGFNEQPAVAALNKELGRAVRN
jgi:hypothetical protein